MFTTSEPPQLTVSDAARVLMQFADGLAGPYGHESSVKLSSAGVSRQRFLLTFPKVALELGADLRRLLGSLAFPDVDALPGYLESGDMLHLALEEDAGGRLLFKFYVEDAVRARQLWESPARMDHEPLRVHRAWKWRPGVAAVTEAHYHWLPCRSYPELLTAIDRNLPSNNTLLTKLVDHLRQRCPATDLHLLRVTESGSARLSLDLNVYDAGLKVIDLLPLLPDVDGVPATSVSSLQALTDYPLGHVASGGDADGRPFHTLYYGACERGGYQ